MKTEKKYFKLIRAVSFLVILSLCMSALSFMLHPKDNTKGSDTLRRYASQGFYSLPENTIDVLFLGHSNIQHGVSPMNMWNDFGFTSFICGASRLRMAEAYGMLRDFLDYQSPKIVVLLVDGAFETDTNETDVGRLESDIPQMLSTVWPVIRDHDLWKTVPLSRIFSKPIYTDNNLTMGETPTKKIGIPLEDYSGINDTDETAVIPPSQLLGMNSIVNLCKDKGINIVFVETPTQVAWSGEKHNAIVAYSENKGIPFIDFTMIEKEIGLDWNHDCMDTNHMNIYGAKKLSDWLGVYLTETYSLTNRMDESNYSDWNEIYKQYSEYILSLSEN